MRVSKILLFTGIMATSPLLLAADKDSVPESCVKLVAALEACEKGPEGPFGTIRDACKSEARGYKCDIPMEELRVLLKEIK